MWPTDNITTTNLDSGTDSPVQARSEIYNGMLKLKDVIGARNSASGVAPLDAGALIPLANIPATLTGKSADTVDGYHAGNGPNNVLALDGSGLVPFANIPVILYDRTAGDTLLFNGLTAFMYARFEKGYLSQINGATQSIATGVWTPVQFNYANQYTSYPSFTLDDVNNKIIINQAGWYSIHAVVTFDTFDTGLGARIKGLSNAVLGRKLIQAPASMGGEKPAVDVTVMDHLLTAGTEIKLEAFQSKGASVTIGAVGGGWVTTQLSITLARTL